MMLKKIVFCIGLIGLMVIQAGNKDIEPQQQKVINFAGIEWETESSMNQTINPGDNFFSSSEKTLWVDSNGWLHLRIYPDELSSKWACASLHSVQPVRYGTHRFRIIGNLGSLDKNVVLGLFLYKADQRDLDDHAEIDYEFSTWGFPQEYEDGSVTYPCSNAQMVFWPQWKGDKTPVPAFTKHFWIPQTQTTMTTHEMEWYHHFLRLSSYWFGDLQPNEEDLIASCEVSPKTHPGVYIPEEEDQMLLNINLWLNQFVEKPSDGMPVEVMIQYEYIPMGR